MSAIKTLLDSLLWDIYGEQRQHRRSHSQAKDSRLNIMSASVMGIQRDVRALEKLDIRKLIDVCAILKVEIRLMAYLLERVLIVRDRNHRIQDVLCGFVDAIIRVVYHDVHPKMRFSLSPPSPKAIFSTNVTTAQRYGSEFLCGPQSQHHYQDNNNSINGYQYNMQRQEDNSNSNANQADDQEASSDYKQWLHAMKLVARLPGGIPPEFRRKLWLSLADKYLKSKNVDWDKQEEKCFCEKWREDDEELGIQIVKDLHRTGSTLCTGPAGDVNQAKLKRILLGYARYNPEVGYCQGFNMLGALILQVMDKEEAESIKVMIYLVEGILPTGYFCGSMGGLQADMAVFRELMQTKLPRLAKHLQKLQGPMENAFEPPLTNVFTMQWFLTMFCTCLPMSCVLRVWDLVLIEGSDVLLRTALALWSLLEERVLSTRSADDFYGKMGSFSSELLNGHLIDSNGLIEKVVQLGPISDIQKLRDKHLYNIAPLRHQPGLHLYYDDDEPDIDEDSRLAVATVWGIPWGRRGSQGQTTSTAPKQTTENKDRIALDISLLKKQYDRLRERQKQAHIILTTACSSARQGTATNTSNAPLPVNQLLSGRPAIVTNKGRRSGPPTGAIPPVRKPSLPAVLQDKPLEKRLRRGETLLWQDTSDATRRRDSLTWKEIKAERKAMTTSGSVDGFRSQKMRTRRLGKSDSSSYSEESDENDDGDGSTSDTSFCDDENQPSTEVLNSQKVSSKSKKKHVKARNLSANVKENVERERPKSWAPSYSDIPFVLMTIDSPNRSADENPECEFALNTYTESLKEVEKKAAEIDEIHFKDDTSLSWEQDTIHSPIGGDLAISKSEILSIPTDSEDIINKNEKNHTNSKLINIRTKTHLTESTNSLGSGGGEEDEVKSFDVSDEGVTNEYFERVNSTDRPTKLDLLYSLNEEDGIRDAYNVQINPYRAESEQQKLTVQDESLKNSRCMDLLVDYSEKSSAACIAEAKSEISTTLQTVDTIAAQSLRKDLTDITDEFVRKRPMATAAEKRRNPRRLTLTRSSTMDIEKRYQALEKRLSMESATTYKPFLDENDIAFNEKKRIPLNIFIKESQITSDESEKIEKGHIDVLESEMNKPQVNAAPSETKRKIPSTADLEERFKIMKLHLVSERTDKIISASDSESGQGQQKNGAPSKMNTTDHSIEPNLNGKKNDQTDKVEKTDVDTNKTTEEKTTITESDLKAKASTSKVNKERKNNNIETEANESKNEKTKTNIVPSKKEPPDIKDNDSVCSIEETSNENKSTIDADTQVTEMSANQTKNIESKNDKVPSAKNSNINNDDDKLSELSDQSKENSKGNQYYREENKESDETLVNQNTLEMNHEKKESEIVDEKETIPKKRSTENNLSQSVQRKSPPSTEELEKRFSALEKQMTITKNASNETIDKPNTTVQNEQGADKENSASEKITEAVDKTTTNSNVVVADIEKSAKNTDDATKAFNTKTISSVSKKTYENSTKRRLSEPPTTEDLERRYEVVKRRMSSRQFEPKTLTKEKTFAKLECKEIALLESKKAKPTEYSATKVSPTSTKANEPEHDYHSPNETLEKSSEELQSKTDNESNSSTAKQSPPSTENLEERYAKLQNSSHKNETSNATTKENSPIKHSPPSMENLEKRYNDLQDNSKKNSTKNLSSNETKEIKERLIQEVIIKSPVSRQKRSALMEELQTKIKANASGELVKPSSINPFRRPISQNILLASKSFNDETSETHATSAYSISGKYEPGSSCNRKMVRRFSDLPSRADLENRLQFLEERLSKTLSKQRRASDSEVASKQHHSKHNIQPSNVPLSGSLEYRVNELEKHLKANRALSMDVERTQTNEKRAPDPEIQVSQIELAGNNVAVTGKELVRYSQFGEITELNHQNPINISINIQMTLPKDDNDNKKMNDLPKAEDLDRRLQILEQQLKPPQQFTDSQVHNNELKSSELSVDGNENQADSSQTNDILSEPNVNAAMPNEKEKLTENCIEIPENSERNHDLTQKTTIEETNQKSEKEYETTVSTKCTVITDSNTADGAKCKEEEPMEKNESRKQSTTEPVITGDTTTKNEETKEESEHREEPTNEIKSIDNLKCNENRNKDQSESNKPYDTVTKNAEDKKNLEVNDSEILTKNQNSKTTKSSKYDEPKSNANENKLQYETQSKTQNNEVTETETNDDIQCIDNENRQGLDTQAVREKSDVSDVISQTLGSSQMVPIEVNKKTLVLLLDNEPKSVKVRRLTRANTEELEDLFQALEKQLNQRSQDKADETQIQSNEKLDKSKQMEMELTQAMADLTKEIQEFSKPEKTEDLVQKEQPIPKKQEEEFDWGIDPNKYHLKKKTVYLPSTKELEARFRSLERQIKLLEDVEKIDVEQRLIEIERKIKLQYSLSHEKDLNKFLELCEGKMVDEVLPSLEKQHERKDCSCNLSSDHRQYTASPKRSAETKTPTNNPEPRYRTLDHKRSMSKQAVKKEPIHPLETLLDPSPDDSKIPTTGELEHRMRVMEDNHRYTPSPPSRKSRSQSPPQQHKPKSNIHSHYELPQSPAERGLPTAEELEARLEALEKTQCFDFKMQKNFQHFNQKLKDIVSPSLSFDEFNSNKSYEADAKNKSRSTTPKPMVNTTADIKSPKTIRFCDEVLLSQSMQRSDDDSMVSTNNNVIQILEENSKMIQRILKKTIADTHSNTLGRQPSTAVQEGLGVMGIRLMRETSPLRRKGTHTGVPLRTGENINDQLTSIKNTIKSINSLCEEKPYRKERCQQYIDALFSDSTYFATKKASLEDLAATTRNTSRSTSREIGPSIRISGHSSAFTRSMGSADSIRSSSPLTQMSPPQYRSNRDLRREPSPRRRRDEELEEHESRCPQEDTR